MLITFCPTVCSLKIRVNFSIRPHPEQEEEQRGLAGVKDPLIVNVKFMRILNGNEKIVKICSTAAKEASQVLVDRQTGSSASRHILFTVEYSMDRGQKGLCQSVYRLNGVWTGRVSDRQPEYKQINAAGTSNCTPSCELEVFPGISCVGRSVVSSSVCSQACKTCKTAITGRFHLLPGIIPLCPDRHDAMARSWCVCNATCDAHDPKSRVDSTNWLQSLSGIGRALVMEYFETPGQCSSKGMNCQTDY